MILIVNALIKTVSGPDIHDGAVLVDGQKIAAVGYHLGAPEDTQIIDAKGMTLTPGLVDAHSHIAVNGAVPLYGLTDDNECTNPVTPDLRIADAIDPFDPTIAQARAGGVTCTQTLPGSANVIGGQGAVIKLKKTALVENMLVKTPSCMKAALGENPIRVYKANGDVMPTTRMGNAFVMRRALQNARNYIENKRIYTAQENHTSSLNTDLGLEALSKVLRGELQLSVHCHRCDDICTAVRIAEEFGIRCTIEHCTEGRFIADWLAKHNVKAAVGPTFSVSEKPETKNSSWTTPAALRNAGVHFCILTDHPVIPLYGLAFSASQACKAGLTEDEALRAITLSSAEHIGMESRIGSVEAGKDADLVLWTGSPLDSRSKAVMTMIDGKIENTCI